MLLELASEIDANQNHLKGNPFITDPTVPCNTPSDAPFSSSLATVFSPSPAPFNNPFALLGGQFGSSISTVSPLSSSCASVLPDCLLKGPVGQNGQSGDSSSSSHFFNGLIDNQDPQKGINHSLQFSLKEMNGGKNKTLPFSSMLDQTRPHLPQTPSLCNGLSNSLLPMVQPPSLCKSETMLPVVQNGGVMAVCPPPQSAKCGRAQRRQKVKV